jgi:hypothetical protein
MGTSKRYAHSIDARMDARIAEGIMRTGAPDTLDPQQLALGGLADTPRAACNGCVQSARAAQRKASSVS